VQLTIQNVPQAVDAHTARGHQRTYGIAKPLGQGDVVGREASLLNDIGHVESDHHRQLHL